MSEVGYQTQSLQSWGAMADEANETNPALRWPRSIEVYDKMRREDSQVGSVLRASSAIAPHDWRPWDW